MPRAIESPGSKVLTFFREAPMEAALLILGLCRDIIRDRGAITKRSASTIVHRAPTARVSAPQPKAVSHHKRKAAPKKLVVKARKRVRPSRAKVNRTATALPGSEGSQEDISGDDAVVEGLD